MYFSILLFSSNHDRMAITRFCGIYFADRRSHDTTTADGQLKERKKSARYVALRRRSYVSPIILHIRHNS